MFDVKICSICKNTNTDKDWVFTTVDNVTQFVCRACFNGTVDKEFTTDFGRYEKTKKRMEADRKANNIKVLQSYRIAPKKK